MASTDHVSDAQVSALAQKINTSLGNKAANTLGSFARPYLNGDTAAAATGAVMASSNPDGTLTYSQRATPGITISNGATTTTASTIADAQAAVVTMANGSNAFITVTLTAGVYRLTSAVTMSPLAGNTGVKWVAAPGARVVITGSKPITGFTESTVNGVRRWSVNVGTSTFTSLWVNGQRRWRPRSHTAVDKAIAYTDRLDPTILPKFQTGTDTAAGALTFVYPAGAINPSWANLTDVEVVTFDQWQDERSPLVSVNDTTHVATIKLRQDPNGYTWPNRRFYLENIKENLTQPGQWYLDKPTQTLTYLPKDGEVLGQTLVTAGVIQDTLIKIDGGTGLTQNITFEGLEFAETDFSYWGPRKDENGANYQGGQGGASVPGCITMVRARNITVNRCQFHHLGASAFDIQRNVQGALIKNNTLTDLGGGGVRLSSEQEDTTYYGVETGYNTVHNNTIKRFGQVSHCSAGVLAQDVYSTRVTNNEVCYMHSTGVSIGWVWTYNTSGGGVIHDNLIEANHIHHSGWGILTDKGGIYTLGYQPGTRVKRNLIHHITGTQPPNPGIYFDQSSSMMNICDNVVVLNDEGIYGPNDSAGLDVYNNIVGENTRLQLADGGGYNNVGTNGLASYSINFQRNVVLMTGQSYFGPTKTTTQCDNNLIWDYWGTFDFAAWKTAHSGMDTASVNAKPEVIGRDGGRHSLGSDSPAFNSPVNFKQIPIAEIGPYPPFD